MNLNEYLKQTESSEVKAWINSNLRNYLEKNSENQGEIEHIIDFLNSDKAPKRLKKMSYNEAKLGSEKWVRTLKKKGEHILETDEDIRVELDFKNGVKLVELITSNAYKREGFLMSHCLGSYDASDSNKKIYSLRDAKNKPHCTIEIIRSEENYVQQIKGKGNGSIHPKYIKYVLKTLEHFNIKVRDSEMENLGYSNLESVTNGFNNFIEKHFNGIKFIMFNGKKFFYNRSVLELKDE